MAAAAAAATASAARVLLGGGGLRRRQRAARGACATRRRAGRRAQADTKTLPGTAARAADPLSLQVRAQDVTATSACTLLEFERNGFLSRPALLSPSEAESIADLLHALTRREDVALAALRHQVRVHCSAQAADACSTMADCRQQLHRLQRRGELPFLQYFNLHRSDRRLRAFALSPRLGFWAAELLGVDRVRLYQDALFVKRPGHGPTHWHSDLPLTPFDTNSFVTVWLALTPVPARGGTGLCFARGSHRDLAGISYCEPDADLGDRYSVAEPGPMEPGDATFHHGWVLHSAAEHSSRASQATRVAWAISFVADGARLRPRETLETEEDCESFAAWIDEVPDGAPAAHPLLPLVPAVDTRHLAQGGRRATG